jgi:hypothetical protein
MVVDHLLTKNLAARIYYHCHQHIVVVVTLTFTSDADRFTFSVSKTPKFTTGGNGVLFMDGNGNPKSDQ